MSLTDVYIAPYYPTSQVLYSFYNDIRQEHVLETYLSLWNARSSCTDMKDVTLQLVCPRIISRYDV